MEDVAVNPEFWHGKRVFVTGQTGFKGSWLSLCLQSLGAEVHGYSLAPPTNPNLYTLADVQDGMARSTTADVRDLNAVQNAIHAAQPEIVFHLAAQPIVRRSYTSPVETYSTNVMGTANLLEAVRACPTVRSVVIVTSDKCYENREWHWGYREGELLGGRDPYSSSKACAELVTGAYRDSFLRKLGVAVASARAGNVIGGGDWAEARLIPDFFRAIDEKAVLKIRFPEAIRPWQHVLEPLSGYLLLAECMACDPDAYAEAWNFGPSDNDVWSVGQVLAYLNSAFPNACWEQEHADQPHEANYLKLDSSKARDLLSWRPKWDVETALNRTTAWHAAWRSGKIMRDVTLQQIAEYQTGCHDLSV